MSNNDVDIPPVAEAKPLHVPLAVQSPFLRAPEGARTIFLVTLAAACGPLLAGIVLFGWRAAEVAAISVLSCAAIERLYYRVSRQPALLGRTHAYLTGVLLALTLPAFVPWYIPVIAAAFAIIVGKCVFGGVGHFLWQPALVGRLAVAVMFPAMMNPAGGWPILAQDRLLVGDITEARAVPGYRGWRGLPAPEGADALKVTPPSEILAGLTRTPLPRYSALVFLPPIREVPGAKPAALMKMPPINDLLYGARPGGLGETCAVVIVVVGLYLVYRNYVKFHLPLTFLLTAWVVVAVAPVQLAGAYGQVRIRWFPIALESFEVGFTYVNYQLLSTEMFVAAFFLATEMSSRPVTTSGQVLFGAGCGAIAALLHLYVDTPIPCYLAVLAMNTFSPLIDALWRPRVLGQKRVIRLFRR